MKLWHLHQDWTLEVHESETPGECGRGPSPPECKEIAKAGPEDWRHLTMLVDAHNAVVNGEESKTWEMAFREQNERGD